MAFAAFYSGHGKERVQVPNYYTYCMILCSFSFVNIRQCSQSSCLFQQEDIMLYVRGRGNAEITDSGTRIDHMH